MSATSWNLKALRSHVRAQIGDARPALDRIRSVSRSIDVFRFHVRETQRALTEVKPENDPSSIEDLLLVLQPQPRQVEASIAAEAHLTGCIYATRSLADLFGQLLNDLLLASPMSEGSCNIFNAVDQLPAGPLRDEAKLLLSSQWFKYLGAFINVTKHRNIVQCNPSVSFVQPKTGLQVAGFTYNKDTYRPYWAEDVLEGVVDVSNAFLGLGRKLNRHLQLP